LRPMNKPSGNGTGRVTGRRWIHDAPARCGPWLYSTRAGLRFPRPRPRRLPARPASHPGPGMAAPGRGRRGRQCEVPRRAEVPGVHAFTRWGGLAHHRAFNPRGVPVAHQGSRAGVEVPGRPLPRCLTPGRLAVRLLDRAETATRDRDRDCSRPVRRDLGNVDGGAGRQRWCRSRRWARDHQQQLLCGGPRSSRMCAAPPGPRRGSSHRLTSKTRSLASNDPLRSIPSRSPSSQPHEAIVPVPQRRAWEARRSTTPVSSPADAVAG
jgi:hypothetical protein